jgi:hypothetical protein
MLSRHAVGTPVFAGMIAATGIGVFLIPMLYVTFQSLRERVKRGRGHPPRLAAKRKAREVAPGE